MSDLAPPPPRPDAAGWRDVGLGAPASPLLPASAACAQPILPGLSSLLRDVDGAYSSRRLAGLSALAVYFVGFFCDLVANHGRPSESYMIALLGFAAAGIGLAALDRFTQPKPTEGPPK